MDAIALLFSHRLFDLASSISEVIFSPETISAVSISPDFIIESAIINEVIIPEHALEISKQIASLIPSSLAIIVAILGEICRPKLLERLLTAQLITKSILSGSILDLWIHFLAALVASSRLPSAKSLRRWPSIPVNLWRSNLPGKSPTAANSSIGTKFSGM